MSGLKDRGSACRFLICHGFNGIKLVAFQGPEFCYMPAGDITKAFG